MANINAPFGFNPVEKIGGGAPGKLASYTIANNEANSIFQGDAVMNDAGNVQQGAAGANDLTGVFWGCKYDDPTTNKPTFKNQYAQVAAEAEAFVYDDPYQVFEIQGLTGTQSQRSDIQKSADIDATDGSTTDGVSGMTLVMGTLAAAGAEQLNVIGFGGNEERNQIDSAGCAVYKVVINMHTYANN